VAGGTEMSCKFPGWMVNGGTARALAILFRLAEDILEPRDGSTRLLGV
jgi:hypothetical protein